MISFKLACPIPIIIASDMKLPEFQIALSDKAKKSEMIDRMKKKEKE